jgi:hypothetical protein
MNRRNGVRVLGAAIVALAGCGSSPSSSNAPATASAACTELLAASAARGARCSGGPVADWMAYEASFLDCAAYDGHVSAGEVQYMRGKFDACRAEYDLPCEHSFNCFYEVLHGLTADGQPCRDSNVCGTDSACFSVDGASCGEVCLRGGVENEACGFYCGGTTPCLDFPFCRYDLVCSGSNVCVKGKSVGATCAAADTIPCAVPAFCTADAADPQSTGTCKLPVPGGACRADNECLATEFCAQGACAARRPAGAPCTGAPTACATWATCDASSATCIPAGKPGAACLPVPGSDDPAAMYCWIGVCAQDGTCIATADRGGSCEQTSCATGTSCDQATLTCVACAP